MPHHVQRRFEDHYEELGTRHTQRGKFARFSGGTSMNIPGLRWWRLILATVVCLTFPLSVIASDEPTLTKEQINQFLLTAKVVNSRQSNKGITNTLRLTLTDGTVTHDASFQAVDEHKARMETLRGTELAFVDSYKYNIAAYRLAELLGIDDMLPVYVERGWGGKPGSLSWWFAGKDG
jgi:hypothetical protein